MSSRGHLSSQPPSNISAELCFPSVSFESFRRRARWFLCVIVTSFHIITDLSSAVFGEVMLKLASSLIQHHPLHIHYPPTIPTLAYIHNIKTPTIIIVLHQGWERRQGIFWLGRYTKSVNLLQENAFGRNPPDFDPDYNIPSEYIWSSQLLKACPTLPELALASFQIYHWALMGTDETWWGLAFHRIQLDLTPT